MAQICETIKQLSVNKLLPKCHQHSLDVGNNTLISLKRIK